MRILLADDHAVVRQGYASLLQVAIEGCRILETDSGEKAVELMVAEAVDLVIMDVGLPGMSGIEAGARMIETNPDARILFFSMYDEVPVVKRALAIGAMGYITKSCASETLVKAVTQVARGEVFIEYDLLMRVSTNRPDREHALLRDLTRREFEVFVMLARGQSNNEIADSLSIEKKTVANTISSIKRSLGIESIGKLIFFAIDAGIVQIRQRPD